MCCAGYPKLKISILQKKALRVINFASCNAHTSPLKYAAFWSNCFSKDSFSIFTKHFKLTSATHSCNTRSMRNGLIFIPSYNSVRFRRKSNIHSTTLTWNHLQDKLNEYDFFCLSPKSLKVLLLKYFIFTYNSKLTSLLYASLTFNSLVVIKAYVYSDKLIVLRSRIVSESLYHFFTIDQLRVKIK